MNTEISRLNILIVDKDLLVANYESSLGNAEINLLNASPQDNSKYIALVNSASSQLASATSQLAGWRKEKSEMIEEMIVSRYFY